MSLEKDLGEQTPPETNSTSYQRTPRKFISGRNRNRNTSARDPEEKPEKPEGSRAEQYLGGKGQQQF